MFHRILVGVDGVSSSDGALRLAARLAAPEATIVVVHVLRAGGPTTIGHRPRLRLRERTTAVLERARELLGDRAGVEYLTPVAERVADGLHRVADGYRCDLIVVGASRRDGVAAAVLRGDAAATIRRAPCPVAVVPPLDG
ncbi:universal stress protein [Patulibacter defluvii]|uniref:universal stress protein n=1 Tax=Patulibacter defluvii TaxID=3095358 RepID=UPI002A759561|nr:universal stress protein [Patulibacter sp. DM4]